MCLFFKLISLSHAPSRSHPFLPPSSFHPWLILFDAQLPQHTLTNAVILEAICSIVSIACWLVLKPFQVYKTSSLSSFSAGRDMQNKEDLQADAESDSIDFIKEYETDDWANYKDNDVMQQQSAIWAEEAAKLPFVGDKEPLSSLTAEYQSGSPILLEKIKVLSEQYAAFRRTRGDGNCFFRSFMFSYLEHILESQDQAEVERISANVEECRKTLQDLGYADFTFEDFFSLFLEQLESVLQGNEAPISHDELIQRCRDQSVSDYVVMFFRFVTSGEIRKRSTFFEPFILGLTNATVEQFCKTSVEPMGEESDHVHIIALSDALGVAIRVVYLDRSSCDTGVVSVNHHDFIPSSGAGADVTNAASSNNSESSPFITLLYRPGHYDIMYPK